MLPSALALLAVAGVVLLLIGIFGDGGTESVATPSPNVTTTSTAEPTTTPSQLPTTATATVPPPTTTSVPATSASTLPPPPLPTAFPDIATVVLNSTAQPGLAGRVSEYLAGLGWTVGPAGNFDTAAETTTVYFPEGYEEAARALAAAMPGSASAVVPVVEGVAPDALTVVLGEDAVDWLPVEDEDVPEPEVSPSL